MSMYGGLLTFVPKEGKNLVVSKAYVDINRNNYMANVVIGVNPGEINMDAVKRISLSVKMDGGIKFIESIPVWLMDIKESEDGKPFRFSINCKDLYEHSLGSLPCNNWTKLFFQLFGKKYAEDKTEVAELCE